MGGEDSLLFDEASKATDFTIREYAQNKCKLYIMKTCVEWPENVLFPVIMFLLTEYQTRARPRDLIFKDGKMSSVISEYRPS